MQSRADIRAIRQSARHGLAVNALGRGLPSYVGGCPADAQHRGLPQSLSLGMGDSHFSLRMIGPPDDHIARFVLRGFRAHRQVGPHLHRGRIPRLFPRLSLTGAHCATSLPVISSRTDNSKHVPDFEDNFRGPPLPRSTTAQCQQHPRRQHADEASPWALVGFETCRLGAPCISKPAA